MKAPAELAWLTSLMQRLALPASGPRLLRIALFTLALLVLAALLLPAVPVRATFDDDLAGTGITPMATSSNDSRWVRDDIATFPVTDRPRVAWISGSSVLIRDGLSVQRVIPDLVNQALAQPADLYMYTLTGQRALDTYLLTQDAIARQPDLLVLTINPFWILNEQAVYYKANLFNRGASLWWNSRDWSKQLLLVPPSAHLWNIAGRHLPIIARRYDYQRALLTRVRGPRTGGSTQQESKQPARAFDYSQPLTFWIAQRKYKGDLSELAPDGADLNVALWQAEAMIASHPDSGVMPRELLEDLLQTIADSGIPAVLYMAPVAPELLENAAAAATYATLKARFQELTAPHQGPGLQILTDVPADISNSLEFADYLHLREPGRLPAWLAARIDTALAEGRQP